MRASDEGVLVEPCRLQLTEQERYRAALALSPTVSAAGNRYVGFEPRLCSGQDGSCLGNLQLAGPAADCCGGTVCTA